MCKTPYLPVSGIDRPIMDEPPQQEPIRFIPRSQRVRRRQDRESTFSRSSSSSSSSSSSLESSPSGREEDEHDFRRRRRRRRGRGKDPGGAAAEDLLSPKDDVDGRSGVQKKRGTREKKYGVRRERRRRSNGEGGGEEDCGGTMDDGGRRRRRQGHGDGSRRRRDRGRRRRTNRDYDETNESGADRDGGKRRRRHDRDRVRNRDRDRDQDETPLSLREERTTELALVPYQSISYIERRNSVVDTGHSDSVNNGSVVGTGKDLFKREKEGERKALRRPGGRSLTNVTRGLEKRASELRSIRNGGREALLIEVAAEPITIEGGSVDEPPLTDYVDAFRRHVANSKLSHRYPFSLVDVLFGKGEEETLDGKQAEVDHVELVLRTRRELTVQTRDNPMNSGAWLALSNLSGITGMSAHGASREDLPRSARRSELQRKREVLMSAVLLNPDDIDLWRELLRCMEQICDSDVMDGELSGTVDESDLMCEYENAISHFEGLAKKDMKKVKDAEYAVCQIKPMGKKGKRLSRWGGGISDDAEVQSFRGSGRDKRKGMGRGVTNLPAWMTRSSPAPLAPNPGRENECPETSGVNSGEVTTDKKAGAAPQPRGTVNPPSAPALSDLLFLFRGKLRRIPRSQNFDADVLRQSYCDAFQCLVFPGQDDAPGDKWEPISACAGSEASVLFLDYLRAEAEMGYSERAVGMVQAVLELNILPKPMEAGEGEGDYSFRSFWDSESPRIGDSYPDAGWTSWREKKKRSKSAPVADLSALQEYSTLGSTPKVDVCNTGCGAKVSPNETGENKKEVQEVRRRKGRRLRASDFFSFEDSEKPPEPERIHGGKFQTPETITRPSTDIASSETHHISAGETELLAAYKLATSLTTSKSEDVKLNGTVYQEKEHQSVDEILKMAQQAAKPKEPERCDLHTNMSDSIDGSDHKPNHSSPSALQNLIQNSEVVPSQVRNTNGSGTVQVYSLAHRRRIEVSRDELSSASMKDILRRALRSLRDCKENKRDHTQRERKRISLSRLKIKKRIHFIDSDDPFLVWAQHELLTQDNVFQLPLRSVKESSAVHDDPNRTVLFEDISIPYLSDFEPTRGIPALVVACLRFLGVSFPRATNCDQLDSFTFGDSGGGNRWTRKLNDLFTHTFNFSQLPPQTDQEGQPFWAAMIYEQILVDESVAMFDFRLFDPVNTNRVQFVRNLLHSIAGNTRQDFSSWVTFIQVTLITFEAEAAQGDLVQAQSVARSILSGTEAADFG